MNQGAATQEAGALDLMGLGILTIPNHPKHLRMSPHHFHSNADLHAVSDL